MSSAILTAVAAGGSVVLVEHRVATLRRIPRSGEGAVSDGGGDDILVTVIVAGGPGEDKDSEDKESLSSSYVFILALTSQSFIESIAPNLLLRISGSNSQVNDEGQLFFCMNKTQFDTVSK